MKSTWPANTYRVVDRERDNIGGIDAVLGLNPVNDDRSSGMTGRANDVRNRVRCGRASGRYDT